MIERPILMSAPMVLACLREVDPKTQTRRILKPQPISTPRKPLISFNKGVPEYSFGLDDVDARGLKWWRCPYGVPGDRIIVRETFRLPAEYDDKKPSLVRTDAPVWYEADSGRPEGWGKTRVSIHMPHWASRLTLEITDVRVERLNDCSDADALAEGVVYSPNHDWFTVPGVAHPNKDFPALARATAREMYATLWDVINGPGAWLANPWVWVVTFQRVD